MDKLQRDVKEFMEGVGQNCPASPITELDDDTALLRINLIQEELNELIEALGFAENTENDNIFLAEPIYVKEKELDPVAIADALTDLLYVVYGCANTCGIDLESIWNEVQRSNMSKLIDGYKREDGKWMKGPSYSPPNIAPLIEEQND
jgi:predicted HAD superfamily Cof-like phosphohydrolase